VPEHGADRMGRAGALYEIAQWFPRAAVYEDVRGWNIEPYLGQGEFYLDYGDYALAITVPAGYVVAATCALQNPRDVLTTMQIARDAITATSDTVVRLITAHELANAVARLPVGCHELEGDHGLRLLSPVGGGELARRRRPITHVDHRVHGALVPVSVAAHLGGGRSDQRHGVSDDRDGEHQQ